jgi:hypothetical protein
MTTMRLLILSATAILAVFAPAQIGKMDPFDFHVSNVEILQDRRVQSTLGVTEAQRGAMNRFAQVNQKELGALQQEYQKAGKDPRQALSDPRSRGYFLELKTNVCFQLTKAQLHRLSQITLQSVGIQSILDDVVAKKIGLSSSQLTKERSVYQSGAKQATDLQEKVVAPIRTRYLQIKPKSREEAEALGGKFRDEIKKALQPVLPQVKAISNGTEANMKSILTASQRSIFASLQGPKYTPGK